METRRTHEPAGPRWGQHVEKVWLSFSLFQVSDTARVSLAVDNYWWHRLGVARTGVSFCPRRLRFEYVAVTGP